MESAKITSEKKIALIACYFGSFPPWMNIFLESCKLNQDVDFIFFTDCNLDQITKADNIKFIRFTLTEFNQLATSKLDLTINLSNDYKLCDLKPGYGVIFEDYLRNIDFWGHIDIDLVFGNIRRFVTNEILDKYDVITPKAQYLVGHFTLFRNDQVVNSLFTLSKDYKLVFTTPGKIFCFDECNFLWFNLLAGSPLSRLKSEITSMTHVVRALNERKQIKAYFRDHILEQDQIEKIGNEFHVARFDQKLVWRNGSLFNVKTSKEYMYFHFHFMKKELEFSTPSWPIIPKEFYISRTGFFS